MLRTAYDSAEGQAFAARVAEVLRDASYEASVELAKERGAFPLFDAGQYLESGFAQRLPKAIRRGIKLHGLRNSHLNSIAPTGTISLAFADNASNGIEPPYAWLAERRKRAADGGWETYPVMDHAFRLWMEREENRGKDPEEVSKALPEFSAARSRSPPTRIRAWSPRCSRTSIRRSQRRSTCRRTTRSRTSRICT